MIDVIKKFGKVILIIFLTYTTIIGTCAYGLGRSHGGQDKIQTEEQKRKNFLQTRAKLIQLELQLKQETNNNN